MDFEESSDQILDVYPIWIRQHGPLVDAFAHTHVINTIIPCIGIHNRKNTESRVDAKWCIIQKFKVVNLFISLAELLHIKIPTNMMIFDCHLPYFLQIFGQS